MFYLVFIGWVKQKSGVSLSEWSFNVTETLEKILDIALSAVVIIVSVGVYIAFAMMLVSH